MRVPNKRGGAWAVVLVFASVASFGFRFSNHDWIKHIFAIHDGIRSAIHDTTNYNFVARDSDKAAALADLDRCSCRF